MMFLFAKDDEDQNLVKDITDKKDYLWKQRYYCQEIMIEAALS